MRSGRLSVVAELKDALIAQGSGAFGPTVRVSLPAVGSVSKCGLAGQAMHDAQLHNVQAVIERAGNHGQARAGLLVQRPESEVVAVKIVKQCLNGAREKMVYGLIFGRQKVIVHAPCGPDESVQNVRGRRDDVFLEPEIAALIGEGNTPGRDWLKEAGERAMYRIPVL